MSTNRNSASAAATEVQVARESVDDALMIVASYGPWGADLNDAHRRQIVLADEVHRLRHLYEMAVHGRAEMRAALRQLSDALRAALAEPAEQEPVAWSVLDKRTGKHWYTHESKYTAQHYANEYSHREPDGSPSMVVTPLYTAPQPRRRLTDEDLDNTTRKQVDDLLDHIYEYGTAAEGINYRVRAIARAIERAHGIGEHE